MKIVKEGFNEWTMQIKCHNEPDANGRPFRQNNNPCGSVLEITADDVRVHHSFKYPNENITDYVVKCPKCGCMVRINEDDLPKWVRTKAESKKQLYLTECIPPIKPDTEAIQPGAKIYLAGSCSADQRPIMVMIASSLRDHGYNVFCPFEQQIDEKDENGNWKMKQEPWAIAVYDMDIHEIEDCDAVLAISMGRMSSAGTNFELGYAKGIKKKSYVLQYTDADTSVMTYAGCTQFANSAIESLSKDCIDLLEGRLKPTECTTTLT